MGRREERCELCGTYTCDCAARKQESLYEIAKKEYEAKQTAQKIEEYDDNTPFGV
jgi:hypothetical protein